MDAACKAHNKRSPTHRLSDDLIRPPSLESEAHRFSDELVRPSPLHIIPETVGNPVGSPCQPVRFNADAFILVPIVKDASRRPILFIYKHLQKIGEGCIFLSGVFELSPNEGGFDRKMYHRLENSDPVLIRNPFKPEGSFSFEFLRTTYHIDPNLIVDIHGGVL